MDPPQTPDEMRKRLMVIAIAERLGGMPSHLVNDQVWAAAWAKTEATYIPMTEKELDEWYRTNVTVEDTLRWLGTISKTMRIPNPDREK